MVRDKIHMEQVERWAEFVKRSPRWKWKQAVNLLVDAQYEKADAFYKRLEGSEKGREILKRLEEYRRKGRKN